VIIRPLRHTDLNLLLTTFNLAFSDYVLPMHLTQEQLSHKLHVDQNELALSAGVELNNELVAFILHGFNKEENSAYNGGTGVIPTHRGKGLTGKMYDFILPQLQRNGVKHIALEVVTSNQAAIKAYEKIGFRKTRELACFKGELVDLPMRQDLRFALINPIDWNLLQSFWEIQPAWQYNPISISLHSNQMVVVGAYLNDELVGYFCANINNKRIMQLAVHSNFRQQKIGISLTHYFAEHYGKETAVINVDTQSQATLAFLHYTGLVPFINQYEMILEL